MMNSGIGDMKIVTLVETLRARLDYVEQEVLALRMILTAHGIEVSDRDVDPSIPPPMDVPDHP